MTANCPTPSAPSQRAIMIPAATLLKIINRRVAKVHATWDEKRISCQKEVSRKGVKVFLGAFASSLRLCVKQLLRIDPSLVPQTQIQQRPEMKSPILRSLAMLLQHATHKPVVQQLPTPHPRVHQVLVKPPAQPHTQQRPEMKSPILRSLAMLLQHATHKPLVHQLPTPHPRVHQVLVKPPAQTLSKR